MESPPHGGEDIVYSVGKLTAASEINLNILKWYAK
jgi:hypothetical protein